MIQKKQGETFYQLIPYINSFVTLGVDDEGNKTVNEYSIIRNLGSGAYGKGKP